MPWPNFTSDELAAFSEALQEDRAAHEAFVEAFYSGDQKRLRDAVEEVDRTHALLRSYAPLDSH